jgi:hypothetical protein
MGRGMAGVWREGGRRRAACTPARGWLGGAARYDETAAHGCEARGAKEEGRNGGSTAHGPAGRSLPRCAFQRGRGAVARDASATVCALDVRAKTFPINPL